MDVERTVHSASTYELVWALHLRNTGRARRSAQTRTSRSINSNHGMMRHGDDTTRADRRGFGKEYGTGAFLWKLISKVPEI